MYLYQHLNSKDSGEHIVEYHEHETFYRVRGNVGALHGQCDAVEANEEQDGGVKPLPRHHEMTHLPNPETKNVLQEIHDCSLFLLR